ARPPAARAGPARPRSAIDRLARSGDRGARRERRDRRPVRRLRAPRHAVHRRLSLAYDVRRTTTCVGTNFADRWLTASEHRGPVAWVVDMRCAASAALLVMLATASARADDPPAPPPPPPSTPTAAAQPEPDDSVPVGEVIVITSTTPLHGSHLPKDHVPANVQ